MFLKGKVLLILSFISSLLIVITETRHNVSRIKRIVNGKRVSQDQAPYIASLQILESSDFVHFCTGTYLGQGFVLTASHCLKYVKMCEIYIQLGQIRLSQGNNKSRYGVENSCRKRYDIYTYNNDIALVKLNMSHNDPLYNMEYAQIPPNYQIYVVDCKIYGFGAVRYGEKHSEYLLTGDVKPIDRNRCTSILGNVITPDYHMGMFCASGDRGVDACSGDSGGGLFCTSPENKNVTLLIGLVSYGMGCGSEAGIYTSTIHHINWIEKTMKIMA